eukprot:COSAG06_NODE_18042_length_902_cov_58.474597_1_plen_161_part_10
MSIPAGQPPSHPASRPAMAVVAAAVGRKKGRKQGMRERDDIDIGNSAARDGMGEERQEHYTILYYSAAQHSAECCVAHRRTRSNSSRYARCQPAGSSRSIIQSNQSILLSSAQVSSAEKAAAGALASDWLQWDAGSQPRMYAGRQAGTRTREGFVSVHAVL